MCKFKKTMKSDLIPERLTTRLVDSNKFEGNVRSTEFEIRENRQVSHKHLFPIIKGSMEVQGDITSITLLFERSKTGKISDRIFYLVEFLVLLIVAIISEQILITVVGSCAILLQMFVYGIGYVYFCRRAYRKLYKIWDIKRFRGNIHG